MPLPPLEDTAFWESVIETESWRDPDKPQAAMSLTDLMAAFVARRSGCSARVEQAVARRIIDGAASMIRRNVSWRHPDRGYGIVDNVVSNVMRAMAEPEKPLAIGLATAFEARVRWLIHDEVRASRGWTTRKEAFEDGMEEAVAAPPSDPTDAIEREQTIAALKDPRDKRMLRDHYDGFTWEEIGVRNACDPSTARKRIQRLLAAVKAGDKTKQEV